MLEITLAILIVAFLAASAGLIWVLSDRSRLNADLARVGQELRHGHEALSRTESQRESLESRINELNGEIGSARTAIATLQTRIEESARSHEERLKTYAEARIHMADTFKALAGDALKAGGEELAKRARELIQADQAKFEKDYELRHKAIDGMVRPVRDSLKTYDEKLTRIEAARREATAALKREMELMNQSSSKLTRETEQLVRALRTPHGRGLWGEMLLRRVFELAGMTEHCDFEMQVSVETDDGARQRPDAIVTLPNERTIVIDAKTPVLAYLDAVQADTDEERDVSMTRFVRHVREQVKLLSHKSYWSQFDDTPDFVIMFVPGEVFLAEAFRLDPTLLDDALQQRVVPATPASLFALLKAVAFGWQQAKLADDARDVISHGRELHKRLGNLLDHLIRLGANLEKAVKSYNDVIGSYENRLKPHASRFEDLHLSSEELPSPTIIDHQLREARGLPDQ